MQTYNIYLERIIIAAIRISLSEKASRYIEERKASNELAKVEWEKTIDIFFVMVGPSLVTKTFFSLYPQETISDQSTTEAHLIFLDFIVLWLSTLLLKLYFKMTGIFNYETPSGLIRNTTSGSEMWRIITLN